MSTERERGVRGGASSSITTPLNIDERHGSVPRWLMVVYIALGIWMIYYLIQYWRP